jgi:hypothetical protein
MDTSDTVASPYLAGPGDQPFDGVAKAVGMIANSAKVSTAPSTRPDPRFITTTALMRGVFVTLTGDSFVLGA